MGGVLLDAICINWWTHAAGDEGVGGLAFGVFLSLGALAATAGGLWLVVSSLWSRRWWFGAFEGGVVRSFDSRKPIVRRWEDLTSATYVVIDHRQNSLPLHRATLLTLVPGLTFENEMPDVQRVGPMVARLHVPVVAERMLAEVCAGKEVKAHFEHRLTLNAEGLTKGKRFIPYRQIWAVTGHDLDTGEWGTVRLYGSAREEILDFYLGPGLDSRSLAFAAVLAHLVRTAAPEPS